MASDAASLALQKLTGGQTLTNAERQLLGMSPVAAPAAPTLKEGLQYVGSSLQYVDSTGRILEPSAAPKPETPSGGNGKVLGENNGDVGQGDGEPGTPPEDPNAGWTSVGNQALFNGTPYNGMRNGINFINGYRQDQYDENGKERVVKPNIINNYYNTPAKSDAQTAAELKAADQFAQKQKASDAMIATFKQYGLESLATFIGSEIMADVSPEALLIKLYDQPEYQARFPGMKALQAKNRTITEANYISLENQYAETLRFFDLPAGFMDDRATFGKMIANEVSPKELQDRAQVAQDLAKTTNPAIRKALTDFYGVGEGGITAYVLDSDKALPLIQKQAKTATIAGVGSSTGFNLTNTEADLMASKAVYANMNESDMNKAFSQAQQLRDTQQRLAMLDQTKYNQTEALSAVVESDQQALLASQKRAQNELARFGGSSGLSSGSLRESSGI